MKDVHPVATTLEDLPEQYDYIREVVMNYTRSHRDAVDSWKKVVDALTPQQLAEVAAVYQTMAARGDAKGLSAWIEDRRAGIWRKWKAWSKRYAQTGFQKDAVLPEPQQEGRAKRLFELFNYLGEKGIVPFNSGEVQFDPPPVQLDWSRLPSELQFLVEPAMKWGVYQYSSDLAYLQDTLTADDLDELRAIAVHVRRPEVEDMIHKWFRKCEISIYPEARLVFFMLRVISEFVK